MPAGAFPACVETRVAPLTPCTRRTLLGRCRCIQNSFIAVDPSRELRHDRHDRPASCPWTSPTSSQRGARRMRDAALRARPACYPRRSSRDEDTCHKKRSSLLGVVDRYRVVAHAGLAFVVVPTLVRGQLVRALGGRDAAASPTWGWRRPGCLKRMKPPPAVGRRRTRCRCSAALPRRPRGIRAAIQGAVF